MRSLLWIFKDKRTNPGRLHRIGGDGNPVAVVEILREGDVDASGHDAVEFQKVTPTHLPADWQDPKKHWGPNGEWLGAHGILFIYEDEYPELDPHDIFSQYEAIRAAGPPSSEVTQDVPVTGGNDPGKTAPHEDSRDLDHDGVVTRKEEKEFNRTHPHGAPTKK